MTPPAEPWQRDATAVAEALFASRAGLRKDGEAWTAGPPPASRIAWLVDDLDHFLGTVSGRSQLLFRAALTTVVLTAPKLVLSFRPFHSLSLEDRVQALERLEHSPLGLAVFAVKTLLCFIWYEHPDSEVEAGLVKNVTALTRYRGGTRGPR